MLKKILFIILATTSFKNYASLPYQPCAEGSVVSEWVQDGTGYIDLAAFIGCPQICKMATTTPISEKGSIFSQVFNSDFLGLFCNNTAVATRNFGFVVANTGIVSADSITNLPPALNSVDALKKHNVAIYNWGLQSGYLRATNITSYALSLASRHTDKSLTDIQRLLAENEAEKKSFVDYLQEITSNLVPLNSTLNPTVVGYNHQLPFMQVIPQEYLTVRYIPYYVMVPVIQRIQAFPTHPYTQSAPVQNTTRPSKKKNRSKKKTVPQKSLGTTQAVSQESLNPSLTDQADIQEEQESLNPDLTDQACAQEEPVTHITWATIVCGNNLTIIRKSKETHTQQQDSKKKEDESLQSETEEIKSILEHIRQIDSEEVFKKGYVPTDFTTATTVYELYPSRETHSEDEKEEEEKTSKKTKKKKKKKALTPEEIAAAALKEVEKQKIDQKALDKAFAQGQSIDEQARKLAEADLFFSSFVTNNKRGNVTQESIEEHITLFLRAAQNTASDQTKTYSKKGLEIALANARSNFLKTKIKKPADKEWLSSFMLLIKTLIKFDLVNKDLDTSTTYTAELKEVLTYMFSNYQPKNSSKEPLPNIPAQQQLLYTIFETLNTEQKKDVIISDSLVELLRDTAGQTIHKHISFIQEKIPAQYMASAVMLLKLVSLTPEKGFSEFLAALS